MVRDLGTLTATQAKADAFVDACLEALAQAVAPGVRCVGDGPFAGASKDHRPKAGSRAKRSAGRRQHDVTPARHSQRGPEACRTACLIWRDPWMAVGPDSYTSALLETAGFENVFSAADGRYPETTLEAIVERSPDVILLPDEPYEFGDKDKRDIETFLAEQGHGGLAVLVEGSHLTWFGTRTLLGLRHLSDLRNRLGE